MKAALLFTALTAASAASAQSDLPGRVGRLESEMRAVQRKVFPGGAGQTLQPEVTPPDADAGPPPGIPASSPVADLSQRVSSLEQQVATLTGQVEQNGYRLRQLEDGFAAYRRATDAKLAAMASAPPTAAPVDTASDSQPAPPPPRPRRPAPTPAPAADDAAGGGDHASSTAIEKPSTGDPAEDAYMYGYRLWAAKKYPEAESALKQVVAKYPNTRRASYAQNLLGRSYMDEGKYSLASIAFYDNYKKMPDGERAPDSLNYLAQSLLKLKKPEDACKVYSELTDVYGAKLSAGMKADVAKGRAAARCQ